MKVPPGLGVTSKSLAGEDREKAVEVELNKAGWRLAALLEASLPTK